MTVTLVLGGARSGKSAWAERRALASGREVVYIATGHAGDAEMTARIALHRAQRPAHWTTVEEPALLAGAILAHAAPGRVLLVDCLTLWLSNVMFSEPPLFSAQRAALLNALVCSPGDIILVSNEVGMGIVPMGAGTRAFADEAGRLNQAVAALSDEAVFIAAGLPLMLKGPACSPG